MDFKEATTRLMRTVGATVGTIAAELGVSRSLVEKARISTDNTRTAPQGWEPVLARMARELAVEHRDRAADLERLAEELEGRGKTC